VQFGGVGIYVLHDIADLKRHPAPAGTRVVVTGHSHKPLVREEGGVLYVNPGSAGTAPVHACRSRWASCASTARRCAPATLAIDA
jgi:predicted phosphodiesterase